MAKPNYAFAKRQKELAKKQKKEEKRMKKEVPTTPADGETQATPAAPADEGTPT